MCLAVFVEAVQQLGGPRTATPRDILALMPVPGLSRDNVKSHLQKYRQMVSSSEPQRPSLVLFNKRAAALATTLQQPPAQRLRLAPPELPAVSLPAEQQQQQQQRQLSRSQTPPMAPLALAPAALPPPLNQTPPLGPTPQPCEPGTAGPALERVQRTAGTAVNSPLVAAAPAYASPARSAGVGPGGLAVVGGAARCGSGSATPVPADLGAAAPGLPLNSGSALLESSGGAMAAAAAPAQGAAAAAAAALSVYAAGGAGTGGGAAASLAAGVATPPAADGKPQPAEAVQDVAKLQSLLAMADQVQQQQAQAAVPLQLVTPAAPSGALTSEPLLKPATPPAAPMVVNGKVGGGSVADVAALLGCGGDVLQGLMVLVQHLPPAAQAELSRPELLAGLLQHLLGGGAAQSALQVPPPPSSGHVLQQQLLASLAQLHAPRRPAAPAQPLPMMQQLQQLLVGAAQQLPAAPSAPAAMDVGAIICQLAKERSMSLGVACPQDGLHALLLAAAMLEQVEVEVVSQLRRSQL